MIIGENCFLNLSVAIVLVEKQKYGISRFLYWNPTFEEKNIESCIKNVYFVKIPVQSFIPEIENEMPRDIRQDGQISGQKEYWKQLRSLEKRC